MNINTETWDEASVGIRAAIDFVTDHGALVVTASLSTLWGPTVAIMPKATTGGDVADILRAIGGSWASDGSSGALRLTQDIGGVTVSIIGDDSVRDAYAAPATVVDWSGGEA